MRHIVNVSGHDLIVIGIAGLVFVCVVVAGCLWLDRGGR